MYTCITIMAHKDKVDREKEKESNMVGNASKSEGLLALTICHHQVHGF